MRRSRRASVPQLDEDFTRWRDDPFTKHVFRALAAAQAAQKAEWEAISWGGGKVRGDDLAETLKELRVRHDAYGALLEITPADIRLWLGIDDAE